MGSMRNGAEYLQCSVCVAAANENKKNGDESELGTIRDFTVFNQMFQNSSLFTYNQLGIRYWQRTKRQIKTHHVTTPLGRN